ncbi:MAG: hypothetical protein GC189_07050 [Alphaproteobacteria bacterium]|nr:hypothetical protein [Alphaproteobacteria bacterium]
MNRRRGPAGAGLRHHPVDREEQRIERGVFGIAAPVAQVEAGRIVDAGRRRRIDQAGDHGLAGVHRPLRGVEKGARADAGVGPYDDRGAGAAKIGVCAGRAADVEARALEHVGERLRLMLVLADTNNEHVRHAVSQRALEAGAPIPLFTAAKGSLARSFRPITGVIKN